MNNAAASYVTSENIHEKSMYRHIYTEKTHKNDPKWLKKVKNPAKNGQKQAQNSSKTAKNDLKLTKNKLEMV